MSNVLATPTRKLIAASVLAVAVATGGIAVNYAFNTQPANAQINVQTGAPSSFADLVEAVSPAVVSIRVRAEVPARQVQQRGGPGFQFEFPDLPEDHPLRRFFDQFEEPFGESPRGERPNRPRQFMQAVGSGFIISDDGFIVTNNHVVEGASEVTVVMQDDTELAVDVIGLDPRTDLALLKVREERSDLPYVEFAEEEARVGDWVVAVGNPFGLGGTVTAGIISARGRDINASAYDDFLQIDAAVNRGNSGGPSFDVNGRVVGVNTAIFSPSGGNVGIAFAIPAAVAQQVIADLQSDGVVTRGFLGVSLQDLNDDLAAGLGLENTNGALVTEPVEGAPAAAAGVLSGDVIVSVDGQPVRNGRELSRTISQRSPGTDVELGIIRGGEEIDLTVTLERLEDDQVAEAPSPDAEEAPEPETTASSIGIALVPNPDGDGLVVESIEPDSAAAERGILRGDVILEANATAVNSVAEFEEALTTVRNDGRSAVPLKIEREGVVRFVGVPLNQENAE
jgi:serine protease Do